MDEKWFAIYTRARFERKVAERLSALNITNYCPLNKVVKQWSDRKKVIEEPFFKSYVFLKVNNHYAERVKNVPGVVNYVYQAGKPAIIADEEISAIQAFLNEYHNVKVERAVAINDYVKITRGPFQLPSVQVLEVQNKIIKVQLPSLGYQMVAKIGKADVELVK